MLLEQSFAKDEKQTIADLLGAATWCASHRSWSGAEASKVASGALLPGSNVHPRRRRRLVVKMSGEALAASATDETIDAAVRQLAQEIAEARASLDLELAVMVGGGNIWRGTDGEGQGLDRATSDTMGMPRRVINALALRVRSASRSTDQGSLRRPDGRGLRAVHPQAHDPPPREAESRDLAAGMGNPYFTTDTSAALRAAEIEADLLLKGTHQE